MKRMLLAWVILTAGIGFQDTAGAVQSPNMTVKPMDAEEKSRLEARIKVQLDALLAKQEKSRKDLVEQASLYYWVGQISAQEKEKLQAYEAGLSLMEPLARETEDPEPVLLWSANAGGLASLKRNFSALKMLDLIEQRLLTIAEKHPAFGSGAADRALAHVYLSAPRFVSVGSPKKALKHARLAFEKDPHHPGNLLLMAKISADDGDHAKADALFKEALDLATPDRYPLEYAAWRTEALEGLGAARGFTF